MSYVFAGQMFDHTLTALKGWPREAPLDISGSLSSSVNINSTHEPAKSGMCIHVSGFVTKSPGPNEVEFEMGAAITQMPIFLIPTASDFDVANPGVPAGVVLGGTTTNLPAWVPGGYPAGRVSGLVASGAYELETTEYDTDQTYTANQLLRACTTNTGVDAGKLTNQRNSGSGNPNFTTSGVLQYGDPTLSAWDSPVGVVSRGEYTNACGKTGLAFWPCYLPGTR